MQLAAENIAVSGRGLWARHLIYLKWLGPRLIHKQSTSQGGAALPVGLVKVHHARWKARVILVKAIGFTSGSHVFLSLLHVGTASKGKN
jgi:hypothetical protein